MQVCCAVISLIRLLLSLTLTADMQVPVSDPQIRSVLSGRRSGGQEFSLYRTLSGFVLEDDHNASEPGMRIPDLSLASQRVHVSERMHALS